MSQRDQRGRFAYPELDRVLHERARLGILTCLLSTTSSRATFNDLRELCDLTDGNLSRHLQILQDAGLVEVWKGFKGKRPQTLCRITAAGRTRFREYLNILEHVISDALPDEGELPARGKPGAGWSPA